MNLLKRAAILVAVCSALAAPIAAATERIVERLAAFVLSMFAPAPMRLAADGEIFERRIERPSLANSLLESLRHEKGVPRYGAARGC